VSDGTHLRILVVSQFWPGPRDPDLGVFVAQLVDALERRGHALERVVVDRRGGSRVRHPRLATQALRAAVRMRPDVIYAHFLVPAGAFAAAASVAAQVPLVVTAHGRDVRNLEEIPGIRAATSAVVRRATAVVAVSGYLRSELERDVPAARGKTEVVNCGVDMARFAPRDPVEARRTVGWDGEGPFYLFVGTLDDRKNVVRLADAFHRLERGSLCFLGDGPLRPQLEGRRRVRLAGRVSHFEVPAWVQACDVLCLPSRFEAFGQVLIEAMACERSVVATRVGGPPELVTPETGVLVDPESVESIADGMRRAAQLGTPNTAARGVAAGHDLDRQAQRVEEILARAAARSR
jgi:glycosyltransferase involved in cell wall biosynthesis